jgi:competence protein ComEA
MLKKFLILATTLFALFVFQPAFAAVEINTADQAALDGIAGIGPATSKAILDERKKNGNFKDWSDLEQRVRGIGDRNSVKLSAAGLVVNGQPKNSSTSADKPAKPAKIPAESSKATQQKN